MKRQADAILPIFKNALSVFDNCFSTYTLSFDILLITEIKESHLLRISRDITGRCTDTER